MGPEHMHIIFQDFINFQNFQQGSEINPFQIHPFSVLNVFFSAHMAEFSH